MKELLKIYLRGYSKKYFLYSILAILFMICDVGIVLIIPTFTANIITKINSGSTDLNYVINTGIIVVAIALVAVITTILNNIFAQLLSTRITADLRRELFIKVQNLSFSNVDKISSGTLMTVITNDTNQIQQLIMMSYRAILRSPLTLLGAIFSAFTISKDLFVIILIAVPILGFGIFYVLKTAAPIFLKMQEKIDDLNAKLIETVSGVREIKSFVTEIEESQSFELVNENYNKSIIKANKLIAYMDPIIILISNLAIASVLVVSSYLASKNYDIKSEVVGDISAYIAYLQQIIMSLMMLSMVSIQISRGQVSAKRIHNVLDVIVNIFNKVNPISKHNINGRIEFVDVSFGYSDEDGTSSSLTLENINFQIEPNSTIGIIGSTGSGKTSLVQLLPRLYDVTSGEILIDGINVKDYELKSLREQISYVTQESIIFSGTIKSNIIQGKEDATLDEIKKAADDAVACEFIEKLEKQYDSEVNQGGKNLSGGQRQRLSLTRAIVRNPSILILDDSTSAVDAKSEGLIKDYIHNFRKRTTIIVAQKISTIKNCDRIIVLDNAGHLDGYAPHNELMNTSKVYQEIYASQFGGQNE